MGGWELSVWSVQTLGEEFGLPTLVCVLTVSHHALLPGDGGPLLLVHSRPVDTDHREHTCTRSRGCRPDEETAAGAQARQDTIKEGQREGC
eukprot:scaffold287780_cov15-Tisochrysis_lutea.AAC.1